VDGREDLKAVIGKAHVITVARRSGGNNTVAVNLADELREKWRDHFVLFGHAAKPNI
jgi:hypothetical protein